MRKQWFITLFIIFFVMGVAVWFLPLLTIKKSVWGYYGRPPSEPRYTTIVMMDNFKAAFLITLYPCLLMATLYFRKLSPLWGLVFLLQAFAGVALYRFALLNTDFHLFDEVSTTHPSWYVYQAFGILGCLCPLVLGIRYIVYYKDELYIRNH